MKLEHLLTRPEAAAIHVKVPISPVPVQWLEHIGESCPEDHIPMVAMVESGHLYRECIAVVNLNHYKRWLRDSHEPEPARTTHSAAPE